MENKTKAQILFIIVIGYAIIWKIIYKQISTNINYLLWGIWAILIILTIYWFSKKTPLFKKMPLKERAQYRSKIIYDFGIFKIGSYIGYIASIAMIGFGIYALITNHPQKTEMFWTLTITGLILFSIIFYCIKKMKEAYK